MNPDQNTLPPVGDTLYGDGGSVSYWLARDWSLDDIRDEWDWLFDHRPMEQQLNKVWLRPRWTTPEERADPDRLYELFGEAYGDIDPIDPSVYYEQVKPDTEGAHLYWTVD